MKHYWVIITILKKFFSNSLLIYQVKTKSTTVKEVCKPVLISKDFVDFLLRLLLSFGFDWKDISYTRDSV